MIHNKISLPYKVGPIKLTVKGVTMCKDSLEFYFLLFHVEYHEKKKINIWIYISKKHNAPLIVSKNETLTRVSIMFFEAPTLHISKIMPICLHNTLLKSNKAFMIVFTLIWMVGKGPMHSSTEGALEKAIWTWPCHKAVRIIP
jgi:hypothetical protein